MTKKKEPQPKGEDALKPVISHKAEIALHQEEAFRGVKEMIDKMTSNEDFSPLILARINGEFVATAMKEENGIYQIPQFKAQSKLKLFWKGRRVDKIMKKIHPALKRDIGDVAKIALMRKSDKDLIDLEKKLKNRKARPQIKNRIGCVFLELSDGTSIQI